MTDPRPAPLWPAGLADMMTPAQMAGLSGRELLERVRDGLAPAAPIARLLNFQLTEVGDGTATFEGDTSFDLYNPIGSVHGGWYGVLLDSAMGCAIHTRLPRGKGYLTLEYKENILRGAREDTGTLRALGVARHVGRQTATADGTLVGPDGKVYASGTTTCLVFDIG